MPNDPIHSDREGGIFIPYDKLLQQQSDKLDKILDELREMEKRKLDIPVFESFRSVYEQRHDNLRASVDHIERDLIGRPKQVADFEQAQKDIEVLFTDKAEREALKAQARYWLAGGGLMGLLVLTNLVLNFWQLSSGGLP